MKASNANKVISVLLSVAMCPMMVPTAAFAADDGTASGASTSVEQAQPADQAEASGTGASSGNTLAAQSEAAEAATGEAATGEAAAPATAPAPAAAGETAGEEAAPAATATINGCSTFGEAVQKATVDAQGVITYEVTGKVNVDSTGWVQVRPAAATNAKVVKFVGKSADAEICITQVAAILADQENSALSVEFNNLTLSKLNPEWAQDFGHSTNYFTTWLRNTDAASNCVTYTNCKFPNGVCNNQFGKTVFNSCTFSNAKSGSYSMWVYGGNVEISGGSFTGVRGVKVYTEGAATVTPKVDITGASFTGISEKAAIVVSKPATVKLSNVSATDCAKGLIQKAIEGSTEEVTLNANGTGIGGNFNITASTGSDAAKAEFNLNAGTLTSEVSSDFLANGFTLNKNGDDTFGVAAPAPATVAEVNGVSYPSLQEAINAAPRKATVKLLADTKENVTISTSDVTLDLNGHTLNGGTVKGKPALTVTARVTVKDSSAAQTGTIMREDTAENSGVSSHYVIDVQGGGWLTFESGNVTNNSGAGGTKGASLVRVGDDSIAKYPGLNIKGGNFTQNNFIVIKVDRGDLFLNGGTLNSANSYAIENWFRATVKGGTVNGAVAAWTYSGGSNSDLTISGGTINGDVTSVNYGSAEGKVAKVSISGGTVTGALDTRSYDPSTNELTSIDDATKATIAVTGGTFSTDPSRYLIESFTATQNPDGTYGVAKAYLAQVGETSYYTMDEAFKAQTASGEAITLLRDYTTGSTFNSGTVARVVDLNGHTWTCTGTDANSAAFEINNPDASLTVKNGKIVSSQLIGLIPSASGRDGIITYDNSTLMFENVEASTTATSGIETNGNNTNDTVVLKNSKLDVPNGFGIYFPSSGTLTIDNSTIKAKTMGAQVCSGDLNVTAGSAITVSGDPVEKLEGDGAIQDGAAISIVNRPGYKDLGQIAITGGTFTAKAGNAALKAYTWDSSTKKELAFDNSAKTVAVSGGTFSSAVSSELCAEGCAPVKNEDGTYGVKEETRGTEARPYTLAELGVMTRAEYAAAQEALGGTMYVAVGNYTYDKNGVLGNGERNDTPGQNPDHSKLNAYGENGYLNEKNDGANGKNIVFVKGSITSGATGYTSIDNIGTSLLLAVPAYTNVTFKGTTFNNVMSFDYQLYTSPWSQLGELKFDGCTFNGIIVGAIAAQTLTFNGCKFKNYTNTTSANNSNPTWIRPAYGNWTAGDNKGQGGNFQSLTKINFTGNTVTSTRPVKFERISQWDIRSAVTVTNNSFDISPQEGDTKIKNVGLYLGAHTKTNAFDLVADNNTKSENTAALYTIPEGETSLPLGSTVTNKNGDQIELTDALKWKAADAAQDKIVLKTVKAVASVGAVKFATLTEAINAAQDGQTVTLLGDVVVDDTVIVKDKGAITLDLNGKTISNTKDIWNDDINNWSLVSVRGESDLTITGNGAVDALENDSYAIDLQDAASKCTIENGAFTGNISAAYVFDGSLTINGGTFDIRQLSGGHGDRRFTINCYDSNYKNGTARVSISGGTFNGFDPANNLAEGTGTAFTAPGYTSVANADGTYGVVAGVAQIGAKAYATLADAVAAAQDGDTITLLSDCSGDGIVVKDGAFPNGLTIDFAGHSYTVGGKLVGSTGTATNGFQLLKGNTIVMRNGSIFGDKSVAGDDTTQWSGAPAIMIQNYSNLTLDGMTVKGGRETCYTLSNNNGDTVIRDSTIFAGQNTKVGGPFAFDVCRYASYPSVSVTVEGSSVIDGCVEVSGIIGEGQSRQLTITGGTFRNPISVSNQPANIAISGGTFATEIPADYCAAGYAPTKNADDTYGVKLAEGAYLLQDYRSGDQASWTYPTQEGMAFAGWYKDAAFETPCTESDAEGAAYARFVKITDLLQFRGGSLRMDVAQPSELTWLRFGYTMALPEGASFIENGWYFKKVTTPQSTDVRTLANNNVLNIDGTITANLVFTGVTTNYYSANFSEKAFVKYVTADGTTVEAVESDYQVRLVLDVADAILAHPMASKAEKDYAKQIKAAV